MAICFVVFNPAQRKRIVMNYFYAKSKFELQMFPTFTIELIYEGRTPEIPNAIPVHTNSYMFHKENLYRILVDHIPKQYQKLAFLDIDIFFKDPTWYEKTSQLLDTYDVVQPFETAYWLDLTYTVELLKRTTILLMPADTWSYTYRYHPGFAWCMRRDWYEQNGFFDYAVSGGGDMLSCAAWLKIAIPKELSFVANAVQYAYEDYKAKIQLPRITYLKDISVYHLYHGWIGYRQYEGRHKMLEVQDDIRTITSTNEDGVLEWKDTQTWNPLFLNYFEQRQEDMLSYEARIKPHTNFVAPPAPAINMAPNKAPGEAVSSANK